MGGPTMTKPLFESPQDFNIMQRIRANTPTRMDYVNVAYDDWALLGGTSGTVTVGDAAGIFGGDSLILTTDGTGANFTTAQSDVVAPLSIAIPQLETHGMLGVIAKCSDWTQLQAFLVRAYNDIVGDPTCYVEFEAADPYHVFQTNNTWQFIPLIRQDHPTTTPTAVPLYSFDVGNDGLQVTIQDNGQPVTVTLGPFFWFSTAWGPRGGISFFFDKGLKSAATAVNYALEHGIGCSIAVIPEKVGTPGYMGLDELRNFYLEGVEICATCSKDLTKIPREERLSILARTKRWLYNHNFIDGADMFVYPDGEGRSGFWDAWVMFDVMRHFSCARTTQNLPGTTLPPFAHTLPCLRVTTQNAATLGSYVTYATGCPGSCQFYAFRGFGTDALDPLAYSMVTFCSFVDTYCSAVKSCPPLAMVSQPGCGAPDLSVEDIEGPLKLVVEDDNTTSVIDVLEISHIIEDGSTAGNGVGTGLEFISEDASGNHETAGRINCLFPVAAHATQTYRMDLRPGASAAGAGISVIYDGTNTQVGVGTTTPTAGYKLDVTGGTSGIRGVGTTGRGGYFSSTSSDGAYCYSGSGNALYATSGARSGVFITNGNSASRLWAVDVDSDNAGAGGVGGIDLSSFSVDEPVLQAVDDAINTPGTLTKQIAVMIDGTVYYLYAYTTGTTV